MNLSIGPRQFLVPPNCAGFAQCHAATLAALPSGDLLAAFFAGSREGVGDTAIWLSRRHAGTWQPPLRLVADPGTAHWNPVLHADGARVWLFYKTGPTVHEWITRIVTSGDGGVTWSAPRPLVPGDAAPRGPVKNKILVLANGDWLAPASVENDRHWDAFVDHSADQGLTWHRANVPLDHQSGGAGPGTSAWRGLAEQALWETDPARTFAWDGVIQPTLWQSSEADIHMLLRSTRGRVYRSDSSDGGATWRPAYATDLPNNNSGLDLARTPSGTLVLACNPVAGNWASRSPLTLLASSDNGLTWPDSVALEDEDGEFSYPAIIAVGDALHIAYTWNRTNIVHRDITVGVTVGAPPQTTHR